MLLALVAVLLGLGLGLATRGSLDAAKEIRPLLWWAPLLAAGLYVLPVLVDDLGGEAVLAALSLATLFVATLANRQIAGLWVVAIGLGLNLVPLAIDGATTVGPDAAATVGLDTSEDLGVARRLEITEDRVGLLGDRIPLPGVDALVSFGDLIIAVALVDVGLRLTRRERRQPLDVAVASTPAAAAATEDDPWFALVRGDVDDRAEIDLFDEQPAPPPPAPPSVPQPEPVLRLTDDGDEGDGFEVPFVETGTIRHDELDLSLVRWADEPEHTGADTDELDLRDLQGLLDDTTTGPPSTSPEAPRTDAPPAPSGFDATLARFDRDHGVAESPVQTADDDGRPG